jgi:tryptophan synthase beta chain
LAKDPNSEGSLGIAISEAVEMAVADPSTCYTLGSVLNHVLLHQTVIGLEAKKQFEKIGLYPDVVFGPCGGGSSFGGIAFPFLADKAAGDKRAEKLRLVAVEPTSCPTLTKGAYAYDYGDASGYTPIMRMFTLGHDFMPPGIHAGGLRYHGDSPLVSQLVHEGLLEAMAVPQVSTFEAGVQFARAEGIIPAPEACHAIRAAVDEALACKASGEPKTILFNLTGHGHFDMASYDRYFAGQLEDYSYPAEAVAESLKHLPKVG